MKFFNEEEDYTEGLKTIKKIIKDNYLPAKIVILSWIEAKNVP